MTSMRARLISSALVVLAGWTTGGRAAESSPCPDSFVARLEALALLQSLNADLLSHNSATATLERWCADHRLADPARIAAERVEGVEKEAGADVRSALDVGPDEPLRYRRVRLKCGDRVLSEADNWYVPARLAPEMNRALETTDTPFGKAVAALHFRRRTVAAELLWSPLPKGWEMGAEPPESAPGALRPPAHVLEHRAILSLPDGTPFSEVIETYTAEVLGFTPPK
jgi:chorismate-pyruvate lyase